MATATSATGAATSANAYIPASERTPSRTMNQDDFLKVLMAQFTTQNPISPMKDTESIAAMAQFTTLEQSKATTAQISTLQATSMIGRKASVTDEDNEPITGTVTGVTILSGVPRVIINGSGYTLDKVFNISQTPTN
jgi:flagellar basal-body rod modification protein FlgD